MRPIRRADDHMIALAIYRVRRKGRWSFTPAKETGYEGVACLDDAARAAWLFLDVWDRYRLIGARDYAEGFLAFVHAMQQPDGRFVNFITNWRGTMNNEGPTSYPGGPAWTARAVMALARSANVLGMEGDLERLKRAWPHIKTPQKYKDLRALHILAALEAEAATGDDEWLYDVRVWADEILDCKDWQGRLLNELDAPEFHFWGHIQPAALALAGARLKWTPYVDAAVESVRLLIEPIVRGGFALPQVLPYDVSSVIFNLKALHQVTLRQEYSDLLHLARAWFRGRNPAGQPVYDPEQGLCHDGVDNNRVSENSGAESNIEGAFALLEELPWTLMMEAPTQAVEEEVQEAVQQTEGESLPGS
jgi:hypothetical protein